MNKENTKLLFQLIAQRKILTKKLSCFRNVDNIDNIKKNQEIKCEIDQKNREINDLIMFKPKSFMEKLWF